MQMQEIGVNTDVHDEKVSKLRARVAEVEKKVSILRRDCEPSVTNFRLQTIAGDEAKVAFYTRLPSYARLRACFEFLGARSFSVAV